MAIKNNEVPIAFDPTKSRTASLLASYSDQALFQRYFMKDNQVSWLKDFNHVLNKKKDNSEEDLFPLLVSLVGEPLDYIPSIIEKKISPYVPEGYKLNSVNIAQDLEAIFKENTEQVRKASANNKATLFIIQVMIFAVQLYNRGIDSTQILESI